MKPKNFDITALFNRMSLDQLLEMHNNMLDQLFALDKFLDEKYSVEMQKYRCDQLSILKKYIAEKYPDASDPEVP